MKTNETNLMSSIGQKITEGLHPLKYAALALALTIAGCGGGSDSDSTSSNGGDTSNNPDSGSGDGTGDGTGDGDGNDGTDPTAPVAQSAFKEHFYPIVQGASCIGCHSTGSNTSKSPYFADADVAEAEKYLVASGAVNFANAEGSSIVQKMRDPAIHHCSDEANCNAIGDEMVQAIVLWGNEPQPNRYDPMKLSSSMVKFSEASAGGAARSNDGAIALYTFEDCSGGIARDTSGVAPALDLTLSAAGATCSAENGLTLDGQQGNAKIDNASKLFDAIADAQGSGAYTVEAWAVAKANGVDSTLFQYGVDNNNVNFTFLQDGNNRAEFEARSNSNGNNGRQQRLRVDGVFEEIDTLKHYVITYDQDNGRRIWVDGILLNEEDNIDDTGLNNWNTDYAFTIGSKSNDQAYFNGDIKLLAIYDKALDAAAISTNFSAAFTSKLTMTFDISDLTQMPDTAIELSVRELDTKGYSLFNPILKAPAGLTLNIPIRGLNIVVNGNKSPVGQSFQRLETTLTEEGQDLNLSKVMVGTTMIDEELGGALALKGAVAEGETPMDDEFVLVFDIFGTEDNTPEAIVFERKEPVDNGIPEAVIDGFKNFEQLVKNFSALTGVPEDNQQVAEVYQTIKDGLLENNDLTTFKAAQQTAIQKFALEYCDVINNDNAISAEFYPTFDANNFNADALITDLIGSLLNMDATTELESMPAYAEIAEVLTTQIQALQDANLTPDNIAASTCASVLGSGLVSVQ